MLTYDRVAGDADAAGLDLRGAFHPRGDELPAEDLPDAGSTLILLGFAGSARFAGFARSPEYADGEPHPLDRWSRRLVDALAKTWNGIAFYPFGGPPWHPFQRWAVRAQALHASPLGLLIHPEHGLWHSYRGAVLLREVVALPTLAPARAFPCETCGTRPCLSACPVGAYTPAGFAQDRCVAHLRSAAGAPCGEEGCLARRACPVGTASAHGALQARFTMAAFLGSRAPA